MQAMKDTIAADPATTNKDAGIAALRMIDSAISDVLLEIDERA